MSRTFWVSSLVIVAFWGLPNSSGASELPVGVWKVSAAQNLQGKLIIQAVKANGSVVGTVFGKPIKGTWNGTKLSFTFSDVNRFDGWLVKQKRGKRGKKYENTLTGVVKGLTLFPVNNDYWPEVGGWYARLEP